MSHDAINSWVQNAKSGNGAASSSSQRSVTVVRATPKDKGSMIMELSNKLLPWLSKMLNGVRDNNGMLLQPAHIRGISIEMAQELVNKKNAN